MSFSVSTAEVGGRMLRGKTSAPVLLLDGTGRSRASSPSAPQEFSVLPKLASGHLCYCLTGVQPQSNSPPGTVPRVKCSLISSLFTTCFQCLIRSLTYTYHLFYISLSKAFVLSFFICIIPTLSEHKMYIFYSFLYYLCVIFLSYD